jgi:predicted dehydrogenase
MSHPPFRLGILGLGEGVSILSAATTSALAEPYVLCDIDEKLCRDRAAAFGLSRYTTSYEEMLADPQVDGIAIYTPDSLHLEHIQMAMEAGKHVICTKPLCRGLEGLKPLYDLWCQSNLAVMLGMSSRFFPTLLRQRAFAIEGKHGKILSAEAHYNGDKRQGSAGKSGDQSAVDWLYTGLVHPVDLIYWHLGEFENVTGFATQSAAGRRLGQASPDVLHFVLQAASGAVGRVTGCFGSPHDHPEAAAMVGCTLRGDTGVSQADYPQFRLYTNFDGEGDIAYNFDKEHPFYFRWGGARHHAGEFQNYLEHFVTAIRTGTSPDPTLADGIRVVAILEAMRRALQERRVVSVAEELSRYGLQDLAKVQG